MASREHTFRSSFFWNSPLTDKRKDEIIEWRKNLSDEDADKLEDLLQDARLDEQFNCDSEGGAF